MVLFVRNVPNPNADNAFFDALYPFKLWINETLSPFNKI
jgi:hypothetical protein